MIDHPPMQSDSWEGYRRVVASLSRRERAADVGSNTGEISERLGKDFEWVHCFEPLYSLMPKERLSYPPNTTIREIGLSDREYRDWVSVRNAWTLVGKDSDVKSDDAIEFKGKSIAVEFSKLDSMLETANFIKLDVDGAEAKVLDGASGLLRKCRPPVMMELSNLAKLVGDEPIRAAEILFSLNYRCISMDGKFSVDRLGKLLSYWPHHTSYDVLFVPNEITLAP